MGARVAILLDGGFVTKKLATLHARFPTAAEVVALTARIMARLEAPQPGAR